jgi:leader peptidase (prepilin peptidase)/N-methyltransferase
LLLDSLYFILGSIVGSFLNVIIYRLPRNLSIISPRSFCPGCSKMIPFYQNIPIISYILQMGKCNQCSEKISIRYLIVEVISAVALLLSMKLLPNPEAGLFYWMFVHLLILTIIDQEWMQIPISILISMALGLMLFHLIWTADLMVPISGLIVGSGFIVFVVGLNWLIFHKQTMGYGDIIIVAILGAWLGTIQIFLTIFLASILALLAFVAFSIYNGFSRSKSIPFVPFLSIAAILIYLTNPF